MPLLHCASARETRDWGERLGARLKAGDVIVLSGELGAGKTLFAGGVAGGLGVKEPVSSPTFILIREYAQGNLPFYHMDAYRITGPLDFVELGYEEYFYGGGVTVIEWGERLESLLPDDRLEIKIDFVPGREEERTLSINAFGERSHKLVEEWLYRAGDGD